MPAWRPYAELRPDELEALLAASPVAYWPLGLLEHHGWHLPIGFDGFKAERICQRLAERTGGVVLPIMWWGGGGGHDVFKWSHYQSPEAIVSMLTTTCRQLLSFGVRALVLLAGHYPWQRFLDEHLPSLEREFPRALLLYGTEVSIAGDALKLRGDHAAREETSFGLALFPELVDLGALAPGRDDSVWPGGEPPPADKRHPRVCFDPADPLFAQLGEDARLASAQRGEEGVARLVDYLAGRIGGFLGSGG